MVPSLMGCYLPEIDLNLSVRLPYHLIAHAKTLSRVLPGGAKLFKYQYLVLLLVVIFSIQYFSLSVHFQWKHVHHITVNPSCFPRRGV